MYPYPVFLQLFTKVPRRRQPTLKIRECHDFSWLPLLFTTYTASRRRLALLFPKTDGLLYSKAVTLTK